MRSLAMCGLLLLALSFNCMAIAPVQIGREHGQAALSMMANRPFTHNAQDSSDLWKWGSSPMGYGQLFPGQGPSNDFGGWAPDGETQLGYATNETPSGYTINETKQLFSGQGYSGNIEDSSIGRENPTDYWLNESEPFESGPLFPSQGFFNGYGSWEPLI